MSKNKKIGIIICIIVIICLGISFAWKLSQPKPVEVEETPPEEEAAPSEGGVMPAPAGPTSGGKVIPCLVLDEEYCNKGEPIYDEEKEFIGLGFNLPEGTKIYAPFNGLIDNSLAATILNGVYYGFFIEERSQSGYINDFNVVGELKTVIEPERPVFPNEPERLANEPVTKEQLVAESTGGGKQRVITPTGNYDIVIYFTAYDTAKNLWSYDINLARQFFPYIKEK